MTALNLANNIANPDELYDLFIALHAQLDEQRSAVVNSKLILLLANHIGDERVIREAIALARDPSYSGRGHFATAPETS